MEKENYRLVSPEKMEELKMMAKEIKDFYQNAVETDPEPPTAWKYFGDYYEIIDELLELIENI